jgi:transcriptional regulator with XRE-family HTH domain
MLGEALSRRREAAGLTQEQLAHKAGIDRTYVSKLERNLQSPTVDMLVRLCRVMGVRPSQLLAEIEDRYRLLARAPR